MTNKSQLPRAGRRKPSRYMIICVNCDKPFDAMKAKTGWRPLPDTLTGLPDTNNPWVECTHCKYRFTSQEQVDTTN